MKRILAGAIALSLLGAGVANAYPHHHHPHRVCYWRHHHRVCHWVR